MSSTSSTIAGAIKTYRLDFANGTYVDLDTGLANLEGGAQFEVSFTRYYNVLAFAAGYGGDGTAGWKDTQVKYLNDKQVSLDGCARATLVKRNSADLDDLAQDESICVSTSEGHWAAMKIIDTTRRGSTTFNVTLF